MAIHKALLKPRKYTIEYMIADDHMVPMKEAKEFLDRQLNCIAPERLVRIYVRIEKE